MNSGFVGGGKNVYLDVKVSPLGELGDLRLYPYDSIYIGIVKSFMK